MLLEGESIKSLLFSCLHQEVTKRHWPAVACKACALRCKEYLPLDVSLCNSHDSTSVPKALQRHSNLNKQQGTRQSGVSAGSTMGVVQQVHKYLCD